MKDCCKSRNKKIFELWNKGMTPEQIAKLPIPNSISYRRIQNIIYDKKSGKNNQRNREIKHIYKRALEETKSKKKAIEYTYNNQPPEYLSPRTIRFILKQERNRRINKMKKVTKAINLKLNEDEN